ncbi:MAG: ATP-dependent helicase DbpA, partial [Pseudomonadota bacterium]
MQSVKFSTFNLDSLLLQSLETLNYTEMTPIQAKSLPFILNGDDIIAKAKTGSGKTVAFGLGVLSKIDVNLYETQALVLCPTRELADQVSKAIRSLARFTPNIKLLTLCGGVPQGHQIASLSQHAPHIVVGTPGRIQDHLKRQSLSLKKLR